MARQRTRPQSATGDEPVSWRDGVHITSTPIWCDALRTREVCFVSGADAVANAKHGQLIATDTTLTLIARDERRRRPESQLAVPYGRPFTLGTRRLELLRSGHSVGSASLVIDVDGERILFAGAVNVQGGGLGGSADVRQCDTVVLCATYGAPDFRFPKIDEISAEVLAFSRDVLDDGGAPVLLVGSATKGLDVASRLIAAGLPVRAHHAIHAAAQRLRAADPGVVPAMRRHPGRRDGEVLLWLAHQRDAVDKLELPPGSRTALVSGSALDPAVLAELRVDTAFAWSSCAGHDELIAYLDSTGARRVYLTHRYADSLAASLDANDRVVRALGPPRQMTLF